MAQFDVHRDPFAASAQLVIELQHDLFGAVDFVLLAPLAPRAAIAKPIGILNPSIKIGGEDYILLPSRW